MNIVVLTGAGISAESGLATFHSKGGSWAGRPIEEICTPDALERTPDAVCAFYDERRADAANAKPNPAHHALAKREEHWRETAKGDFLLVTQNVDGLHQRAAPLPNQVSVHSLRRGKPVRSHHRLLRPSRRGNPNTSAFHHVPIRNRNLNRLDLGLERNR